MTQKLKQETKDELIDPSLRPPPRPKTDKKSALKDISAHRCATAWQIHRWPLTKYVVEHKHRVYLPRGYLGKDGEDVKFIKPGQDLNQFVHSHYMEPATFAIASEGGPANGANFVADDGVSPLKHEYLGPDPRVVGYYFDYDGDIHIKWWDSFLQDQWMDKQKWQFELELDSQGEWMPKDLS